MARPRKAQTLGVEEEDSARRSRLTRSITSLARPTICAFEYPDRFISRMMLRARICSY